mmetsp:Transcript_19879/g.42655  ORF Transcript_19879/g.42655 Transcript_19879/m.42655 type:complete len:365 (-) Transcript_19879:285-1379(-)
MRLAHHGLASRLEPRRLLHLPQQPPRPVGVQVLEPIREERPRPAEPGHRQVVQYLVPPQVHHAGVRPLGTVAHQLVLVVAQSDHPARILRGAGHEIDEAIIVHARGIRSQIRLGDALIRGAAPPRPRFGHEVLPRHGSALLMPTHIVVNCGGVPIDVVVCVVGLDAHGLDPVVGISEHGHDHGGILGDSVRDLLLEPVFYPGVMDAHLHVLLKTRREVVRDPVGPAVPLPQQNDLLHGLDGFRLRLRCGRRHGNISGGVRPLPPGVADAPFHLPVDVTVHPLNVVVRVLPVLDYLLVPQVTVPQVLRSPAQGRLASRPESRRGLHLHQQPRRAVRIQILESKRQQRPRPRQLRHCKVIQDLRPS